MGLCPQSLVGQTHGITSLAKRWWPGCSAPALPHSKEQLYLINQSEGSQRSSLKGRPQLEAQAPSASCCVRGGTRQPSFPRAGCLASPTPPRSPPAHAQLLFWAVDAGAGTGRGAVPPHRCVELGPFGGLPPSRVLSEFVLFSPFFPQLLSPSAGAAVPCRGGLAAGAVNALPPGTGARRGAQGQLPPLRGSSRAFWQSGKTHLLFVSGGKAKAACNRRVSPSARPALS